MDVNRKIAFKLDHQELDIPEEPCPENDIVDSYQFWYDVTLNIICKSLTNEYVLEVKPSYKYWAPYIGLDTARSSDMYNTEYRKIFKRW